jgi:hypothetical protein
MVKQLLHTGAVRGIRVQAGADELLGRRTVLDPLTRACMQQ